MSYTMTVQNAVGPGPGPRNRRERRAAQRGGGVTAAKTGLRALRQERGLSLEAVAVLGDVDPATVSRIERRLVEARPETIVRLARAFKMSARRMKQIVGERDE